MASKTLKAIKEEVKNQLDSIVGDYVCDDVEITCTDKECLFNSVMNKMEEFVHGKETTANRTKHSRNIQKVGN